MTNGKNRNHMILELLYRKGDMSFTDFEDEGIMAKSTLNDHLHELLEEKTVRKTISKKPPHIDHPVYVITAKGRRAFQEMSKAHQRTFSLRDF